MKTITYEEFLEFNSVYLYNSGKKAIMDSIAKRQERWSALDILNLEEVAEECRLWAVLKKELIDEPMLHEFACRCAERALSRVKNPDPRSLKAIKIKRKWMKDEATDDELKASCMKAQDVSQSVSQIAQWHAAQAVVWAVALDSEDAARRTAANAIDVAWASALNAEWTAESDVVRAAELEALTAEYQWQINELRKMLTEGII